MSRKKERAEKLASSSPEDEKAMLAISKAMADPRRVQVLRTIAACDAPSCSDLRERLAMNPATLSHHMKQLELAGLIATSREGKFVKAVVRHKAWKGYLRYLKNLVD